MSFLLLKQVVHILTTAFKPMRHVSLYVKNYSNKKDKAIPVTGREDAQACETSTFPHFTDNRLTDGGKAVSLTRRPPFTPRKIPDTHFC
jgi:hypothetical protein